MAGDRRLEARLRDAGAEHVQEEAPETLTLAEVQAWAEREERVLRRQYPDGLPAEWEAELARHAPATMTGALRRWKYLGHLARVRHEQLSPATEASPDRMEAARQLLRREPIAVELAGRTVEVTSRSYAAMYAIARHALRIRLLDDMASAAAASFDRHHAEAEAARRAGDRSRAARARRAARRLEDVHARLFRELAAHRQALYAHAFSPSGASAQGPEEAPGWWAEVDPSEDAQLLGALFAAGPGRYALLGPPPAVKKPKGMKAETIGWHSLFAQVARQERVSPAELYDRDLYQLATAQRLAAPPSLEDES